tara:strand:+ start:169 stop:330 length:162 start_codon:yes stop_codon:yes gene_type:complete
MNNKAAKKLRAIINPQDKITRKVYRRAKKQYNKTPKNLREDFLLFLRDAMSPD